MSKKILAQSPCQKLRSVLSKSFKWIKPRLTPLNLFRIVRVIVEIKDFIESYF